MGYIFPRQWKKFIDQNYVFHWFNKKQLKKKQHYHTMGRKSNTTNEFTNLTQHYN